MKAKLSILFLLCALCGKLLAQDSLQIDTLHFTENELVVSLPLTVSAKDVKGDYALQLTPILMTAGVDTIRLNPVVFRAKRNSKYVARARYFGDVAPADTIEYGIIDTCWYEHTITRAEQPWMWEGKQVQLSLERELSGCCETHFLPAAMLAKAQYEEPVYAVVEEPVEEPSEEAIGQAVEPTPAPVSKAEMLRKDNPLLRHISEYQPYDRSVPLRKQRGALYIHFQLNKYEIRKDFRANAQTLNKIISITQQILADSLSDVKLIQIIGLASVDGPVRFNEQLSINRANALRRAVQEKVALPDSIFECIGGGEAWTELRDQIEGLKFEGRDELLHIIDTEQNPDVREQKIKKLRDGRPYTFLRQNVLADQRNSGYIIVYYDNQ